jgi:hypothetical protein
MARDALAIPGGCTWADRYVEWHDGCGSCSLRRHCRKGGRVGQRGRAKLGSLASRGCKIMICICYLSGRHESKSVEACPPGRSRRPGICAHVFSLSLGSFEIDGSVYAPLLIMVKANTCVLKLIDNIRNKWRRASHASQSNTTTKYMDPLAHLHEFT